MNKKIFALAVALCIALPLLAGALRTANAATPPTLTLAWKSGSYYTNLIPPADFGKNFTIVLHVDNATNLWSWKIQVTWDPAYLTMVANPTEGSFLAGGSGFFQYTPYANTPGALNEIFDMRLTNDTVTGNGDLATFAFTVIQHGANSTAFTGITVSAVAMQDNVNNYATPTIVSGNMTTTIPGDISGNGKVDLSDLVTLALSYGSMPGQPKWKPTADLSGNGKVDLADLVILATHYGKHI